MPSFLYNFLTWLLSGNSSSCKINSNHINPPSSAIHRRVLSIGQDMMFSCRQRRTVPQKHILLASSVHHLTGSSQLVAMLNRLGHCISLPQLERLYMTIAQRISQGKKCMSFCAKDWSMAHLQCLLGTVLICARKLSLWYGNNSLHHWYCAATTGQWLSSINAVTCQTPKT